MGQFLETVQKSILSLFDCTELKEDYGVFCSENLSPSLESLFVCIQDDYKFKALHYQVIIS
jgi:hypothetical protein